MDRKILFLIKRTLFAIFVCVIASSCSKDDPEPEPPIEEPDPDETGTGWKVDDAFNDLVNIRYARHIERLSNGKLIIAGDTQVARINADGSRDESFPIIETDNEIRTMALQADGKILIGGSFLKTGGQSTPYIACISQNGTVETNFNSAHEIVVQPPFVTIVNSIAVQADGKILVAGSFLTRFNSSGTVDNNFNNRVVFANSVVPIGNNAQHVTQGFITQVLAQSDGKTMIIGDGISVKVSPFGAITPAEPEQRTQVDDVIRLNGDGSADESFKHKVIFINTGTIDPPTSIVQVDDGYIVGGNFPDYYKKFGNDGTYSSDFGKYGDFEGLPLTMFKFSNDQILIGRRRRNGAPVDGYCILGLKKNGGTEILTWNNKVYVFDDHAMVFSEAHDMVKDTDNSVIVAGWFVQELSASYTMLSTSEVVTKTKGLLRVVKKQ